MSNWIDEEGEEYLSGKSSEERKQQRIAESNYWIAIRQQIEKDVNYINTQSVWAARLQSSPIAVVTVDNGYEIQKWTPQYVFLLVSNLDGIVEFRTRLDKDIGKKGVPKIEKLRVDSDGESVFLVGREGNYLIPEVASRYILQPIIDALKAK